jgi:hypothetical protein
MVYRVLRWLSRNSVRIFFRRIEEELKRRMEEFKKRNENI